MQAYRQLPTGMKPIDTSTRVGWLTHLHAFQRHAGEQHVTLLGTLVRDGTVEVAPGLFGQSVYRDSKIAQTVYPLRVAAVHVDILKGWLERQA